MREILFRGKRKDTSEWVEGYYVKVDPVDMPSSIRKPKSIIFPANAECNWFNKYFYHAVEVIPETVGQFIGMRDKNGKRIFEGDILERTIAYHRKETLLISYTDASFCFSSKSEAHFDILSPIDDSEFGECVDMYEIIGNIHDNPELWYKEK